MSRSVELVCVNPAEIKEIWPHVVHMIHSAVKRTNLNHLLDIELDVLHGPGLLWLAYDGKIKAAMTTIITMTERDKVCILTACGGDDMTDWLPLHAKIETYARAEHCTQMRIYGRKGWERVLEGYHVEHVVLEKELN